MTERQPKIVPISDVAIVVNPADNVAVVKGETHAGMAVQLSDNEIVLLKAPPEGFVRENASGVVPFTFIVPVWAKAAAAIIMAAPSRIGSLLNEIIRSSLIVEPLKNPFVMGHPPA